MDFPESIHYLNPLESETMRSPHAFCIPRRCGYELHRQPSDYYNHAMRRGGQKRALFKYTISGRGAMQSRGRTVPLKAGNALLAVIPNDFAYLMPKDSEKWEFMFISFWNPAAVTVIEKIISELGNVFSLAPDGGAIRKAWTLFEIFREGRISDKYSVSGTGYEFLMQICREASSATDKEDDNELLRKVSSYCFRNLNRPVTVDELARHCGYSRWYFSKLFHRLSNRTPSEFIMGMKLDASLRCLREGGLSIKEVARRYGFEDPGYFSRSFRIRFGVSPGKFYKLN